MSAALHHEHGNIFRVEIQDTLTKEDLKRCEDQLLRESARTGPVRLLFILDGFAGWNAQDNWGDLSFFVKHGDVIERIAIVGEERWRDEALMFAAADLRKAPVAFFSEAQEARVWLERQTLD
jgi:SpoIIAA-like